MVLCVAVSATIDIRRGGWLDRLVDYQRDKFLNDVKKIAPVKIDATIIPAPQGYKDSKLWTLDTVMHLLLLIRESEGASAVHRALRRVMRPNRRLMMSMADSFKYFPSLSKVALNEFYYDVGSAEDYTDEPIPLEDGVIVVSNPVEARLPSAQISIKLLKDILEARSKAGRVMPSTPGKTIPWKPMEKKEETSPANADGEQCTTGNAEETGGTEDGDASGGTTAGEEGTGEPAAETTEEPAAAE